jgi:hypothetical protein
VPRFGPLTTHQHQVNADTLYCLFSTIAQALAAAIGLLAAFALFHIQQLHLGLGATADALIRTLQNYVDPQTAQMFRARLETGQFAEIYSLTRAIIKKSRSHSGDSLPADETYLATIENCPALTEAQGDEVAKEYNSLHYLLFTRRSLVWSVRLSLILTVVSVFFAIVMIPLTPAVADTPLGTAAGAVSVVLTLCTLLSFYRSVSALLMRDHPHRT